MGVTGARWMTNMAVESGLPLRHAFAPRGEGRDSPDRPRGPSPSPPSRTRPTTDVISLGWRGRLALPSLGIPVLKAKLDTGARSSSLHVEWLEVDERADGTWLHFQVRTTRKGGVSEQCTARAIGRRTVTDSGGHSTTRWFIHTDI